MIGLLTSHIVFREQVVRGRIVNLMGFYIVKQAHYNITQHAAIFSAVFR